MPQCDGFVHEAASVMATTRQLPSGHWQVQVRLKGRKASETFIRRDHTREWATEAEAQINRGVAPSGGRARRAKTFGAVIDLHVDDMKEAGKVSGGSKSATLEMLQREPGASKVSDLNPRVLNSSTSYCSRIVPVRRTGCCQAIRASALAPETPGPPGRKVRATTCASRPYRRSLRSVPRTQTFHPR